LWMIFGKNFFEIVLRIETSKHVGTSYPGSCSTNALVIFHSWFLCPWGLNRSHPHIPGACVVSFSILVLSTLFSVSLWMLV
jgi:hypothetical protein